jgi:hypothetical protein
MPDALCDGLPDQSWHIVIPKDTRNVDVATASSPLVSRANDDAALFVNAKHIKIRLGQICGASLIDKRNSRNGLWARISREQLCGAVAIVHYFDALNGHKRHSTRLLELILKLGNGALDEPVRVTVGII